jgi:hypothetical protein
MKRLFLLPVLFVFSTVSFGQSPAYHPFPTQNTYWREASSGYQCYCCSEYQYVISGDTLLNGVTYQKITHSGRQYPSSPAGDCLFGGWYTPFTNYRGAIRNDIPGKKIWFVPANEANEQLLYDFSLKLHDTLVSTYINHAPSYGLYNIVESVDSILVAGNYRFSYGIALSYSPGNVFVHLVEGIGSSYGLFGSMGELMPPFEFGSMLLCQSVNGELVYPESTTECMMITATKIVPDQGSFSINPNPMLDYATVRIPGSVQHVELKLFDFSGKEVGSYHNVTDNFIFFRAGLSKGIYFYQFVLANGNLAGGKLIIK